MKTKTITAPTELKADVTYHAYTADTSDIEARFESRYGYAPKKAYRFGGVVYVKTRSEKNG